MFGHVARMSDDRMLFGWQYQPRSAHGSKMRWRDGARKDLNITRGEWFDMAQDKDNCMEEEIPGETAWGVPKRMEDELKKRRYAGTLMEQLTVYLLFVSVPLEGDKDISSHRYVTTQPK